MHKEGATRVVWSRFVIGAAVRFPAAGGHEEKHRDVLGGQVRDLLVSAPGPAVEDSIGSRLDSSSITPSSSIASRSDLAPRWQYDLSLLSCS